jgi:hypothetical protein
MIKMIASLLLLLCVGAAQADATFGLANSVTCPAAGSSVQVLAASAARESYLISNTAGKTIEVGYVASGTAALTTANSIQLLAGQTLADSAPSIFLGRIVCESTDASTAVIYVVETRRR